MSNFNEQNAWAENIRMIMPGDKVIGGVGGQINVLLGAIVNRTLYNKTAIAAAVQSIGTLSGGKADKTTQVTAGAGLTGGGTLAGNRQISLGTPGKLNGTTTNWAGSNTHTHEVEKASLTAPGLVQLSNAIDSSATNMAATPKAVKDVLVAANRANLSLYGDLGSTDLNTLYGSGHYGVHHQALHGSAVPELNYPVALGGALLVMPSRFGALQMYLPSGRSVLYVRDTEASQTYSPWRAIGEVINALNSDSTTAALSAAQGKVLHDIKADKTALAVAAPPGQIAFFAGPNAPAGWLKANGAAVSRTTYAPLFAAIGTRYGAGNGSSTFNLPDLRGEFVRGWDDGRGVDGGRVLGSRQSDEIKSHNHGLQNGGTGGDWDNQKLMPNTNIAATLSSLDRGWLDDKINHTGGNETRPLNVALLACIKI